MRKQKETPEEISEKQDLVNSLFWNNSVDLLRVAQSLINQYVLMKLKQNNQVITTTNE